MGIASIGGFENATCDRMRVRLNRRMLVPFEGRSSQLSISAEDQMLVVWLKSAGSELARQLDDQQDGQQRSHWGGWGWSGGEDRVAELPSRLIAAILHDGKIIFDCRRSRKAVLWARCCLSRPHL